MDLSDKVRHVIKQENIKESELAEMVRLSSPLKDSKGNRRFHGWGFAISGSLVGDMFHVDRPPHVGTGMRSVFKPCQNCGGKGCRACKYHGTILHLE